MQKAPQYHLKWTAKFNHWYNIPVDEYKFILDLAKERFEDVLAEQESITNKSITMATGVVGFSGFILGIAIQNHFFTTHRFFIYSSMIILSFTIFFIFKLIFPRNAHSRGLPPDVSTPDELDNEDDKGFTLQKLHYVSICVLQNNIEESILKNTERITWYKIALISFGILISFCTLGIALII